MVNYSDLYNSMFMDLEPEYVPQRYKDPISKALYRKAKATGIAYSKLKDIYMTVEDAYFDNPRKYAIAMASVNKYIVDRFL